VRADFVIDGLPASGLATCVASLHLSKTLVPASIGRKLYSCHDEAGHHRLLIRPYTRGPSTNLAIRSLGPNGASTTLSILPIQMRSSRHLTEHYNVLMLKAPALATNWRAAVASA